MTSHLTVRNVAAATLLAALALIPVYCHATGNFFLMSLFTRIVILALAAVSLNLIMGFGGMVSFGHAAYIGIGGYAVGILATRASAQAWCSGRSLSSPRRCSRSSSAPFRCARAGSISS